MPMLISKVKFSEEKPWIQKKLYGLGYFGIAAFTYTSFPHMIMHFGHSLTYFTMIASSYYGMTTFQERDIVNSIEMVNEGEHAGKIKL